MGVISTSADQVQHYLNLGVTFDLVDKDEVESFLTDRNYFFKVKAFAKNYEKRLKEGSTKGQYLNLDFGHLIELSRLDKVLRDAVLFLCLDIEHNVKVRINRAAMRQNSDPMLLTRDFCVLAHNDVIKGQIEHAASANLADISEKLLSNISKLEDATCEDAVAIANKVVMLLDPITKRCNPDFIQDSFVSMGSSPYSRNIVSKYADKDMPFWVMMELVSFGPLIRFYKRCFEKNGLVDDDEEGAVCKMIQMPLKHVQSLRNAAAHGDCLLNELSRHKKVRYESSVKKPLQNYGVNPEKYAPISRVKLAIDLSAVLICYEVLVPEGESKRRAGRILSETISRLLENRGWFSKNYDITAFLDYCEELGKVFVPLYFA